MKHRINITLSAHALALADCLMQGQHKPNRSALLDAPASPETLDQLRRTQ